MLPQSMHLEGSSVRLRVKLLLIVEKGVAPIGVSHAKSSKISQPTRSQTAIPTSIFNRHQSSCFSSVMLAPYWPRSATKEQELRLVGMACDICFASRRCELDRGA